MSGALNEEIVAYLDARLAVELAVEVLSRYACSECSATLGEVLAQLAEAGYLAEKARHRGWRFLDEPLWRDAA